MIEIFFELKGVFYMKEFLKNFASVLLIGGMLCGASIVWGQAKVDDRLMDYSKTSGVAGNLSSVGSDTLNNLMTLWAESFRKEYPSVNVQIEGKGSSTAPPRVD